MIGCPVSLRGKTVCCIQFNNAGVSFTGNTFTETPRKHIWLNAQGPHDLVTLLHKTIVLLQGDGTQGFNNILICISHWKPREAAAHILEYWNPTGSHSYFLASWSQCMATLPPILPLPEGHYGSLVWSWDLGTGMGRKVHTISQLLEPGSRYLGLAGTCINECYNKLKEQQ